MYVFYLLACRQAGFFEGAKVRESSEPLALKSFEL
jgi:hypothetical protein